MRPALDCVEHVSVEFAVLIPDGRVVKHSDDVIEDFMDWDTGVLPCEDDAWCNVLKDCGCDLAGWFVEDVGEVVLGQQAVCWIGAVRIGPRLVLVLATGVDDG